MKLFWRDHASLICAFLIQMCITPLLFWLADRWEGVLLGYSLLLSSCVFAGTMLYRYFRRHVVYQRLQEPLITLDESIVQTNSTPLGEALDQLLNGQYQIYQNEWIQLNRKRKDHLFFITQWEHQMKTPLSVMHLTLQEADDPLYENIEEELERMKKGLNMVLYATRLESFEQDFQVELIQLHELAAQVISDNKRLFIRQQIYPSIQVAPSINVYSDEKWLAFILDQLLTNAVRYSGGKGEQVIVRAEVLKRGIELCVQDEGIGIPKEDHKRIFRPFFTGSHGRVYRESTGMGLYLVQQVCEKLKHPIKVESTVGEGTTFRILFSAYNDVSTL